MPAGDGHPGCPASGILLKVGMVLKEVRVLFLELYFWRKVSLKKFMSQKYGFNFRISFLLKKYDNKQGPASAGNRYRV